MIDMKLLVHKKREELELGVQIMGDLVCAALRKSMDCLRRQEVALARQIIEEDVPINEQRRMLEQQCLLVLAAHQPAAQDLREIGASMEIVSDLERIGDYAADVAQVVIDGRGLSYPEALVEQVNAVAAKGVSMLSETLRAYKAGDAQLARATAQSDDEVDAQEKETIGLILDMMRGDPDGVTAGAHLLWAVHIYERVADRATNIAERVIFAATGETVELN